MKNETIGEVIDITICKEELSDDDKKEIEAELIKEWGEK